MRPESTDAIFDVVVVGGGPAGAATAILCAEAGLKVVVCEGAAFPRDRPGETLHPGVEPILDRLGVGDAVRAAGFLRHAGYWVTWGGSRQYIPFGSDQNGPWRGFQAWRATFDGLLLERARLAGATVVQPCRALRPILEGGRAVGVTTTHGPLRATYLADASGGRHWLARERGLAVQRRSPRLVVRYGYAEGACQERDNAPALVADRAGWTWTARVRPRLYQWARLALAERRLSHDWLPDEFRGLSSRGVARGADVTWRHVAVPAAPGYMIAGDAASVLDPTSSHGVLRALMSGMLAGHTIAAIVLGEVPECDGLHLYSWWLADAFERDVTALEALYAEAPFRSSLKPTSHATCDW